MISTYFTSARSGEDRYLCVSEIFDEFLKSGDISAILISEQMLIDIDIG